VAEFELSQYHELAWGAAVVLRLLKMWNVGSFCGM